MTTRYQGIASNDDIPLIRELRTVQEMRAISNPLRALVLRLLKEEERSVKELCELLGETTTRLYYHVQQLERAGLIRLVRTEKQSRSVLKYYRATAMLYTTPFSMLQDQAGSPEAIAGVDVEARFLEWGAADIRNALSAGIADITEDDYYIARFYVRTTPERAREYARKLDELHTEFANSDQEDGEVRYSMTSALVPVSFDLQSGLGRGPSKRSRAGE